MNLKAIIVPVVLSFAISACAVHEGRQTQINPPTLGSELIQLHHAFENGALSEQEYQETKQRVLDSRPDSPHGYLSEQTAKGGKWNHHETK